MRKIFTPFLVFLTFYGNAQINDSIVGKWNMLALYSDVIYYNLKSDSISIMGDHSENPGKINLDSLKTFLLAKLTAFKGAYFNFKANNTFQMSMNELGKEKGEYVISNADGTLALYNKSGNRTRKEIYKYSFVNNTLVLSIDDDAEMFFVLERELINKHSTH